MAGKSPRAKSAGTAKKLISSALQEAETKLTGALPRGVRRLGKQNRLDRQEMLLAVSNGKHTDLGLLIRGPRKLAALSPPKGSRLPLGEDVLSPDAVKAI